LMRERTAIAERMRTEGGHFAAQVQSAEAREAFAAFAEKRPTNFARAAERT
jgi:hypothetical protein